MSLVPIEQVGQTGIIKDVPPYSIPLNAWSNGNNIRFTDEGAQNIDGYIEVMKGCPMKVKHLTFYNRPNERDYWIAFGYVVGHPRDVGKIFCYGGPDPTESIETIGTYGADNPLPDPAEQEEGDAFICVTDGHVDEHLIGETSNFGDIARKAGEVYEYIPVETESVANKWFDITPEDVDLLDDDNTIWSTTFLGAQLIATNGNNRLITWPLTEGKPDKMKTFIELDMDWSEVVEEWETDGRNPVPQTIHSFKSFLIGLNWEGAPTRVFWSSAGGHYSLPTWDWSDKYQDAGDYELNDTLGGIIDGAPLNDNLLIYKEDSIYIASYIGPPFIFGFSTLNKDVGLLTKGALQEFPSGHIFMSKYNVHITNGQSVTGILTDKLQGELFNDISGEHYHNAFISTDKSNSEAYICWPSKNSIMCDRCIVWNWDTGALSLRDLPDVSHIEPGVAELGYLDTWEVITTVWGETTREWGSRAFEKIHNAMVMVSPSEESKIYRSGGLYTLNGEAMESYVERTGIDFGDPGSVKRINAVWPRISTVGGGIVDIWVCGQMSPDDPTHWEGPFHFDPEVQSKISCRVTGKYIGWKIEHSGFLKWQCHGVEFNVEQSGNRGSRSL